MLDGEAPDRALSTTPPAAPAGVRTPSPADSGAAALLTPAPEQDEDTATMDPLLTDESGAQGAQGLISAWSDPDWALLAQALTNGPSTGLRRSLDEGHRHECSRDEAFGGVD